MLTNTRSRTVFADRPKRLPGDLDRLQFYQQGIVRKKSSGKLIADECDQPFEPPPRPPTAPTLQRAASSSSFVTALRRTTSVDTSKLDSEASLVTVASLRRNGEDCINRTKSDEGYEVQDVAEALRYFHQERPFTADRPLTSSRPYTADKSWSKQRSFSDRPLGSERMTTPDRPISSDRQRIESRVPQVGAEVLILDDVPARSDSESVKVSFEPASPSDSPVKQVPVRSSPPVRRAAPPLPSFPSTWTPTRASTSIKPPVPPPPPPLPITTSTVFEDRIPSASVDTAAAAATAVAAAKLVPPKLITKSASEQRLTTPPVSRLPSPQSDRLATPPAKIDLDQTLPETSLPLPEQLVQVDTESGLADQSPSHCPVPEQLYSPGNTPVVPDPLPDG